MAQPKEAPVAATYRFNGIPIRVVFVADDPWFYAADVLDAIGAERELLGFLDDQPGAANVTRDDPIISEAGLYRLCFEVNSDVARSFKRWLAADVFPTLYRDAYILRLRSLATEARSLSGADGKKPKYRHLTSDEKAEIAKLKEEAGRFRGSPVSFGVAMKLSGRCCGVAGDERRYHSVPRNPPQPKGDRGRDVACEEIPGRSR